MEKHRKSLITILTIIAVICLIGVGFIYIRQTLQTKRSEAHLETLRDAADDTESSTESLNNETLAETSDAFIQSPDSVEETQTEPSTNSLDEDIQSDASSEPTTDAIPNPYENVFASNEDIVAWLQIPDTEIDHPVVWTPADENYYLYRDIEGNENQNGSLILDTDSSLNPLTTNLIIHGHNMRSGAMFGKLTDYEDPLFYENHKQIILYTEECQRNYEIIAVFRSQVYKKKDTVFKYYKFFQADTQEEFDDFYQNIKELSLYDTGVTAEYGDSFITLSTCVYHVEQGRFVVVAKEVERGDSYLPVP